MVGGCGLVGTAQDKAGGLLKLTKVPSGTLNRPRCGVGRVYFCASRNGGLPNTSTPHT